MAKRSEIRDCARLIFILYLYIHTECLYIHIIYMYISSVIQPEGNMPGEVVFEDDKWQQFVSPFHLVRHCNTLSLLITLHFNITYCVYLCKNVILTTSLHPDRKISRIFYILQSFICSKSQIYKRLFCGSRFSVFDLNINVQ